MFILPKDAGDGTDEQRARRHMVADIDAVGLHQQVVQVGAAHLDAERSVGIQGALCSLELNVDLDVGRPPVGDHLDLAVGAVVLAIRPLQNKAAAFRELRLKRDDRCFLQFVGSVTLRQVIEVAHSDPFCRFGLASSTCVRCVAASHPTSMAKSVRSWPRRRKTMNLPDRARWSRPTFSLNCLLGAYISFQARNVSAKSKGRPTAALS